MQRSLLRLINRFIYGLSLTLLFYLNGSVQIPLIANAQASAFLVTPYYGEKVISQGYSSSHQAYDYALSYEKVLATADGTVTKVAWFNNDCHQSNTNSSCGFGLYTRINHANNYQTYYAHLSSVVFPFIDQLNGFPVKRGQVIGNSGHTGWSTGPHLHFEVRQNNVNVDPNSSSLWIDGQWANPNRPIPPPRTSGEIIIDDTTNNTGGFSAKAGESYLIPPAHPTLVHFGIQLVLVAITMIVTGRMLMAVRLITGRSGSPT